MQTTVKADRLENKEKTPVIRVKQGTDELVMSFPSFVVAENNAHVLQEMFNKAR